jgi:plasmid stabilization system protein ParE
VPVRVSARARREILAASSWWRENRDKAPHLFDEELRRALDLIAFVPLAGRRTEGARLQDVRVVVLRQTRYLLFYRVERGHDIRVLSLQHARREALPLD